MTWVAAIFGVLWAVSELLTMIPQVNSNGIFQAIYGVLKKIKELLAKK